MSNGNSQNIVNELIRRREEALKAEYIPVAFTGNPQADEVLNNIEGYPHLFVLGCIADRRMPSRTSWMKPYEVCQRINSLRLEDLRRITLQQLRHRVPHAAGNMGQHLHKALERIENAYDGQAGRIWNGNPNCATVVRRFLEFGGVGLKIANMAANILVRELKVPVSDKFSIDISVDVHIRRVFKRLGLVRNEALDEEVIYTARELNPEYPGIFDLAAWEIGRNWCKAKSPNCKSCYMQKHCSTAKESGAFSLLEP